MTLEITDQSLEELQEGSDEEYPAIPAEFISKIAGGIVRCLTPESRVFGMRSGESYDLLFLEPAYVAAVEIEFSKTVFGAGLQLSVLDALSNKTINKKLQQDALSNKVTFSPNCVTTGVSILLNPTLFDMVKRRTLDIKHIKITGVTPKDFESLSETFTLLQGLRDASIEELTVAKTNIESREQKVHQRETSVGQLEATKKAELAALQETLDTAEQDSEEATAQLVIIKDEISRNETRKQSVVEQIAAYEATARKIEGEVSKGKEELTSLAVKTSEAERKLRDLTNNVNLFSEEFSSFSNHGATQARTFLLLSVIPLGIIAILTGQLLMGAVDLSVRYVKEPNLDLLTIFVTRLPYLAICGSILVVCSSALIFLFTRISLIYSERLDFSKIGIIAKDVAFASSNGLLLTDQQQYEARTYLKIEMLKAYLAGNIGAFRYPQRELETPKTTPVKAPQPVSKAEAEIPPT